MTTIYHNFIGIDIGKKEIVIAVHGRKGSASYDNDEAGLNKFISEYASYLTDSFIVVEATGGYERVAVDFLIRRGLVVHRADARKVKNFIRSFGQYGKTDRIDAKAIAGYGFERHKILKPYEKVKEQQEGLRQLYERRAELMKTLVQEKNRLQAPCTRYIREDITESVEALNRRIVKLDRQINELIKNDSEYAGKKQELMTVPGIGEKTANAILAVLPEIGKLEGKKIASLAGVAPHPKQSGNSDSYRRTYGGRQQMKPILFLAAMGARRSKSRLSAFYNSLVERGKKGLVALTALMRKIIVIANARVRDYYRAQSDIIKV